MDTTSSPSTRPLEVWEQRERDGHMLELPDCPVCVQEHGSVVRHYACACSSCLWKTSQVLPCHKKLSVDRPHSHVHAATSFSWIPSASHHE